MFRKTVLTSAVIGAGLVSTAGAAFAGDAPCESHHGHSSSESSSDCSNTAGGSVHNGGATNVGSLLNGSQGALGLNVCHVLDGNSVLSGNTVRVLSPADDTEIPASGLDAESPSGARTAAAPAPQTAPAPKAAPAPPTTETVPIR
ncbi:hypothetical protein [Actinomycetospora atypica]|uniref:Chaplin domain-containing protein n=1 Tax=Actinomycetospora atypica TaxID=1290095 RepID=A0ABV9YR21_9PSEU